MTYEMEYLMHLFSCGAQGTAAQPPQQPLDWEAVTKLAVEQSITYTASLPIKKYDLGCPDSIKARLTASVRGAALKNAIKTDGILQLVNAMEAEGIRVLIIKGIDVARFYRSPECRVSSDTDLLVQEQDEEKAFAFLEQYGFDMEKRKKGSNHAVGSHPVLGMVELHVKLIPDMFTQSLLSNWTVDDEAFSKCIKTEYLGKDYYALEATDSLLFLTYHMIKHFLYGGISLRMMMDNALFAKRNLDAIDKKRYEALLRETKYLYFMQTVFGIMVTYCGFSPTDFPIRPATDTAAMESLLSDLEQRGWQGGKTENAGLDAWYYYRYRNAMLTEDEKELVDIKEETHRDYLHKLFPTMKWMQEMYPKLRTQRWRYPFYLIHRFFKKGRKILTGKRKLSTRQVKKEIELSESARKRVALFRELDMM